MMSKLSENWGGSMYDQATRLRVIAEESTRCRDSSMSVSAPYNRLEGRTIAITSGKGGVGKTNTVVNLALAIASQNNKVGIIDADLGLANIDVLLRLRSRYSIEQVISGKKKLEEIFIKGPAGLTVIPAGSGKTSLANLSEIHRDNLIKELSKVTGKFDIVFIDTAAGISDNVMCFILAAQEVIIITTPEPTAITDAYATLKVISSLDSRYSIKNEIPQPTLPNSIGIIVNMVEDPHQALDVAERITIAAEKFINTRAFLLGYIIKDSAVSEAISDRQPLIFRYPQSAASKCINMIAEKILGK